MSRPSRKKIARCSLFRACNKCTTIANPIVVNRGPHYTLYCAKCGAYIKHASLEDKKHFYVSYMTVEDETPMKVAMLYVESANTMLT